MRIAFLGKGGSGKTTCTAGFISYLNQKNRPVIAVDADHNMHLQQALGIAGQAPHLSDHFAQICTYLAGKREDLAHTTMIDSTPPSLNSAFIRPSKNDLFIKKYALQKENISFLTVGSYKEEDAGKTCYHGKLGSLSLVLNHLLDGKDDLLVSDATAGIDNLGSSLYFAYDLSIFVIEPTKKSIDVYLHFREVAKKFAIRTAVIVNKAEEGDLAFVEKFIAPQDILGVIARSSAIKQFEQGETEALSVFVAENATLFAKIETYIASIEKDWDKYYADLLEAHQSLAADWYDSYYQQPISQQKDPQFSYQKVLAQL